jgi:hypothetical protein
MEKVFHCTGLRPAQPVCLVQMAHDWEERTGSTKGNNRAALIAISSAERKDRRPVANCHGRNLNG